MTNKTSPSTEFTVMHTSDFQDHQGGMITHTHSIKGLLWPSSGWDFTFQSRGCGFDPWLRNKILHTSWHSQKIKMMHLNFYLGKLNFKP